MLVLMFVCLVFKVDNEGRPVVVERCWYSCLFVSHSLYESVRLTVRSVRVGTVCVLTWTRLM